MGIFDPGGQEFAAKRVVRDVGILSNNGGRFCKRGVKAVVAVFGEEATVSCIFVDEVSELYRHINWVSVRGSR